MISGYFFWSFTLLALLFLIVVCLIPILNKKSGCSTFLGKLTLVFVVVFLCFGVWSVITVPHEYIHRNGSSSGGYHSVTYYNLFQTDSVTVRVHDDEVLVGKITRVSNDNRSYRLHITVSDGKKLEYITHEATDLSNGTINVVKKYYPSVTYMVNGTTCW